MKDPFDDDFRPGRWALGMAGLGLVYYACIAGIVLLALHIAGVI